MSATSPTTISTRLRGRALFLARLAWLVLAALMLTVYAAIFPSAYASLLVPAPETTLALRQLGLSTGLYAAYIEILTIQTALGFVAVGAVIFWRRADDWMALLLAVAFVTYPATTDPVLTFAANQTWRGLAGLLASTSLGAGFIALYLFPDGRFTPRWTRWLALGVGIWALSLFVLYTTGVPILSISPLFVSGIVIWMGLGAFAQIYRYLRVASASQRQQTKWWVFGLTGAFLGQLSVSLPPLLFPAFRQPGLASVLWFLVGYPIFGFTLLLIPLSVAFSILRYRLWDIDFVINRSLVYGTLTAVLIAIFGGSLLVVSLIFQNFAGGPLVAVAVSAAVFGAVFQPARRNLQRFVDRRFYKILIDYQPARPAKPAPPLTSDTFTKTHFSNYTGLELVGRGGMAEVYKAVHPTLNQPVALKILSAALAGETEFRKRFLREAQAAAALQHPNIVKVFDYGEADGTYYMVMEYIAGPNLSRFIRERKRLTLELALAIVKEIARALDYAHAQGLVHRDIKPSNVMLDPKDEGETLRVKDESSSFMIHPSSFRAVLTDFGIARILGEGTRLTRTGIIGSLEYIAPEQIQAAATVDGRADVYAFGVMAYEMLTGELPFKHSNPGALLIAHLNQPAPDPRDLAPDLSREAAHAIRRALAKSPDDRYRTAGEFVAAWG